MPILRPNTLEFVSRSAMQTRRIGMRLGAWLQPGDVVALEGDLGSGKTTFIQGLVQGWGSSDPVTSPTFILVNIYRRSDGARFYHLDAYRLANPYELDTWDLESMWEEGPMAVEWADRIRDWLPKDRLTLHLRWLAEEQREMRFEAGGPRSEALLRRLRQALLGG